MADAANNLFNPTALANELGSFILQVAYGAQGQDQTVLTNKVTVADFLTQAFSAQNIKFGNDVSAADQGSCAHARKDVRSSSRALPAVQWGTR